MFEPNSSEQDYLVSNGPIQGLEPQQLANTLDSGYLPLSSGSGSQQSSDSKFAEALTNLENASYSSNLSSGNVFIQVADNAGNTLDTARVITVGETTTTYTDWVGSTDTNDYYRFTLNTASNFSLTLTGLSRDADVALLDVNGNTISRSANSRTKDESINSQLAVGTYFIRVYPYNGNTNYNLNVAASAVPPTPSDYSSISGYGLVNAAGAVAEALNQNPFSDVPTFGGSNDWGANIINAPEVWAQGYTGQGVVVAVLDTGVDYNHSDLSSNIWTNPGEVAGDGLDNDGNGYIDDFYGWNFANGNNNTFDGNGHGTHVSGTIAGDNDGLGVTGIAYNAKIMPVKVLSDKGSGFNARIANGIRYAVDNGADVINMSLGGGGADANLESAIQYASNQGVIVVMAAGNESASQPGYPARYATDWGLAVGAVDSSNNMAYFSNMAGSDSSMAYITAPGVAIYSALPNNSYASWNGTSMASPHVAGVVALMLSANPNLTDAQVRQIITSTAGNSLNATTSGVSVQTSSAIGANSLIVGQTYSPQFKSASANVQELTPIQSKQQQPSQGYSGYNDLLTGLKLQHLRSDTSEFDFLTMAKLS